MKKNYYHPKLSIELFNLSIDNRKHIGLKFTHNTLISDALQDNPEFNWSNTFNIFHCKNTKGNLNWIFNAFRGIVWINTNRLFDHKKKGKCEAPQSVDDWRNRTKTSGIKYCPDAFYDKLERKHYSKNTAKTYIVMFERFMNDHKDKELRSIDENDIQEYLNFLIVDGRSDSYLNQMINAIKFYYEVVEGMPNRFYSIDRPRKKSKLPKVLSTQEVAEILKNSKNIKHRCILSLLYSAGLRRSEVLNLKIEDIDSKRMVIYIKDGKRGKDRQAILDKKVLKDLRLYFSTYRPKQWLFESPSGNQYSGTSIGKILKSAAIKAGIQKQVTPHMLRHSFATHLLEAGTDLRYIQELLGHDSSVTTEIYTQVATNMIRKIDSPINFLNLEET